MQTDLRKVGGSIMLSIPPTILKMLHLQAGSTVNMSVKGDRLIMEVQKRPHYTLDELLSQCDSSKPLSAEDREWLDAKPTGHELL
jgi:antitoxin ChpS